MHQLDFLDCAGDRTDLNKIALLERAVDHKDDTVGNAAQDVLDRDSNGQCGGRDGTHDTGEWNPEPCKAEQKQRQKQSEPDQGQDEVHKGIVQTACQKRQLEHLQKIADDQIPQNSREDDCHEAESGVFHKQHKLFHVFSNPIRHSQKM